MATRWAQSPPPWAAGAGEGEGMSKVLPSKQTLQMWEPSRCIPSAWVDRRCKHCGVTFRVLRSAIEGTNASGNFCSRPCYNAWQRMQTGTKARDYSRVRTACDECGAAIDVTPSKMTAYRHHFCSLTCRSHYNGRLLRRGRGPYGAAWKDARTTAVATQRVCGLCGRVRGLHVHHIIPWRLSHSHDQRNLIPLCRRHHAHVERMTEAILATGASTESLAFILGGVLRSQQTAIVCAVRDACRRQGVEVRVRCA